MLTQLNRLLRTAEFIRHAYKTSRRQRPFELSRPDLGLADRAILRNLATQGYHLAEEPLAPQRLKNLRREVDAAFLTFSEHVQTGQGDDRRLFGVEVGGEALAAFNADPLFLKIARAFLGEVSTVCTMATSLTCSESERSSGGGWHRDRLARQFKVMAYLTDVTEDSGPFVVLPESKRPLRMVQDQYRLGTGSRERRWSDAELAGLLDNRQPPPRAFTGPAGTVILFDSSTIHRGVPIRKGSRIAITNYYYEPMSDRSLERLNEKFRPISDLRRLPSAQATGD